MKGHRFKVKVGGIRDGGADKQGHQLADGLLSFKFFVYVVGCFVCYL